MIKILDFLGLAKVKIALDVILLLLILALIGWAWRGYADRDRMVAWGNTVCASAGAELQPAKDVRGTACQTRIAALAKEEHDTAVQTAQILVKASADHDAKASADSVALVAGATNLRAARSTMEKTNAEIGSDDHVGGDWFRSLNRLGGLQPPGR